MKMTIKELKSMLEKYPEDALALVQGYEGGFSDIGQIKPTKVKLNYYKEEWYGPHEDVEGATQVAILLMRAPNSNDLAEES